MRVFSKLINWWNSGKTIVLILSSLAMKCIMSNFWQFFVWFYTRILVLIMVLTKHTKINVSHCLSSYWSLIIVLVAITSSFFLLSSPNIHFYSGKWTENWKQNFKNDLTWMSLGIYFSTPIKIWLKLMIKNWSDC